MKQEKKKAHRENAPERNQNREEATLSIAGYKINPVLLGSAPCLPDIWGGGAMTVIISRKNNHGLQHLIHLVSRAACFSSPSFRGLSTPCTFEDQTRFVHFQTPGLLCPVSALVSCSPEATLPVTQKPKL